MAFALSSAMGYSQNAIWTAAGSKGSTSALVDRASVPSRYQLFNLNLTALKAQLANAPLRAQNAVSTVVVQFPDGDGKLKSFTIYEAPVMQPGLAAKFPDMKSYVGQGVDKPSETIRFSTTMYGVHNMMFSEDGTSYIDPYTKDLNTYIVYKRAAVTPREFKCGVTEAAKKKDASATTVLSVPATDGYMRTYRLAMACTIEYAAYHIQAAGLTNGTTTQKKAAVLAAMVVTMTRVNGVYERDFAITMNLIDNNDQVIFITTDSFDNNNTNNALLSQSQQVINSTIGSANYDIGHTVSTGGGGVAQLYAPCSSYKAMGITGLFAPVGDPYDIDFVAHEMGHQFGANHTFNNSCDGNRNDGTAYETGSGSTIMGYAGVCFPSVQDHSDAHFHRISIEEITNFMINGGTCSEDVLTGNDAPVADAGADYTIPKGTPFMLTGAATDAQDAAGLTYCWEQMDLQVSTQPPVATAAQGPNFRSLPPASVPQRYFPALSAVVANNLAPTWEVISNVARNYNFALTVRDNNTLGGQTSYDEMTVTVSGTAGPFLVTAPNTNISWPAGSSQTVTWDVAGTTANGVNTASVDILLSNDGGLTYPVVLASQVPNDGSESVTVPNAVGTTKRIMVRGYGNIFYDISNTNFAITAPASTFDLTVNGNQNRKVCKDGTAVYELSYQKAATFTGNVTFSAAGNPAGTTVSFNTPVASATAAIAVTVTTSEAAVPGSYTFTVTGTSGTTTKTVTLTLDILDNSFGVVNLTAPADNVTGVSQEVSFSWGTSANATVYELEVAADAAFSNIVVNEAVVGTSYTASLESNTDYFWRVRASNGTCSGEPSTARTFKTGTTTCTDFISANVPVTISSNNASTVNSTLAITSAQTVSKISVSLKVNHTFVNDLRAVLRSPAGTQVTLFANICEDNQNIDVVFDDSGSVISCGTNPAISGTVAPSQALSAFNGQSAQGAWTLTVTDNYPQDGGQIVSWGLNLCSTTEASVAGIQKNVFEGLRVYPNPNAGDFTVRFTSFTANDIKISVHDIRGRQLLSQSFANTGLIEQPLSLGSVQAGVYLVSIQDGDSMVTKKIIVQ